MGSKKNDVIIHFEWFELFEDSELTEDEVTSMIFAAISYVRDGREPKLKDRALKAVWSVMKDRIDYDLERYEKRAEANRKNGAKGGRPKEEKEKPTGLFGFSEKPNETQGNPTKPKKPDIDIVSDIDTDIVTVPVTDIDIDIAARAREAGPDREKVKKYFREKGKEAEADAFYNYYAALDWKIAGGPVKYWQKLADKWISNIRAPNKAHNFGERNFSYASIEDRIFNQ